MRELDIEKFMSHFNKTLDEYMNSKSDFLVGKLMGMSMSYAILFGDDENYRYMADINDAITVGAL